MAISIHSLLFAVLHPEASEIMPQWYKLLSKNLAPYSCPSNSHLHSVIFGVKERNKCGDKGSEETEECEDTDMAVPFDVLLEHKALTSKAFGIRQRQFTTTWADFVNYRNNENISHRSISCYNREHLAAEDLEENTSASAWFH